VNYISIRYFPITRISGPDGFTYEFHKAFEEELISILQKLFLEIEVGTVPPLFYETSIT
jgi:hypothetical protein